ncbi:MAG: right-handed parallel beta-helix repeat-containing protein [Planctomycetes bacterium]|nr:right-handed parallel beta-helix repeat-containing protein [Planctomycetota bacterium]
MRLQLRTIVGFVAAGSILSATANAAVINVPADFATIDAAINVAACGDEIVVAPGTYNEPINFMGKAITLRSSDGPDVTTIDGTALNVPVVRCVNGEGPSTVLRGFSITGADIKNGGAPRGMLNLNSSPTISHCIFHHNLGGDGAGMLNDNSNPWIENCTFSDNSVTVGIARHGAGMENGNNSNPTVISCTFSGNIVSGGGSNIGGGMTNLGGSNPLVTNCTFRDNIADEGAAMWNSPTSLPTVAASSFCQNLPDDDIFGRWTDGGGNVFGMCRSADLTGPDGVPDGCVDSADLTLLLGAWCSVAGGNPCGTCFP